MPRDVALMTWIACHNYQDGRDSRVQELKTFEHKARVCLLKHPIAKAVSLHFKSVVQLVCIRRILNNAFDRLQQIDIVELEAVGPVQPWAL